MKGLIRNNFYTVEGSLKLMVLLSLAAAIVLAIVGRIQGDSGNIASVIIAANLGGYGALSMTMIQQDAASKWNKFELTIPVSRKNVVTARYISCMLYVLIGVLMAIVSIVVFYLVTGTLNLERAGYGCAFGVGFALALPTFMTPLAMIFGTDKTESLMIVSVIASLVLFFGSSVIMTPFLKDFANADFVFRTSYMAFSVVLFVISYLISCQIYKKKDL